MYIYVEELSKHQVSQHICAYTESFIYIYKYTHIHIHICLFRAFESESLPTLQVGAGVMDDWVLKVWDAPLLLGQDASYLVAYKPLEPRDFKGSFEGDGGPYGAHIGP